MTTRGVLDVVTRPVLALAERVLRTPRLARAPIAVYRARLGFLFGSRMLMLEHVGRSTGRPRYVVLEVVSHPAPDVYVVPSGFGERSQWFRNVVAQPEVHISTGSRTSVAAHARRMSTTEADAVLTDYAERHPRAWATLKEVIARSLGGRVDPPGTTLPMVELTVS